MNHRSRRRFNVPPESGRRHPPTRLPHQEIRDRAGIPNERESCRECVPRIRVPVFAPGNSEAANVRSHPASGEEARVQAPSFFGTLQPPEMEVSSAGRGWVPPGTTLNREGLALESADDSADLECQGGRQWIRLLLGVDPGSTLRGTDSSVLRKRYVRHQLKYSRPGNRSLGGVPNRPTRVCDHRLTGGWPR